MLSSIGSATATPFVFNSQSLFTFVTQHFSTKTVSRRQIIILTAMLLLSFMASHPAFYQLLLYLCLRKPFFAECLDNLRHVAAVSDFLHAISLHFYLVPDDLDGSFPSNLRYWLRMQLQNIRMSSPDYLSKPLFHFILQPTSVQSFFAFSHTASTLQNRPCTGLKRFPILWCTRFSRMCYSDLPSF